MNQEEFLDAIMEAVESEPEANYGDPRTNEYIRMQGIRARVYDLIESYDEEHGTEEAETISEAVHAAEDEIVRLRKKLAACGPGEDDD